MLFIIDLHHEQQNDGCNEADIKLKRSLLNQLNSACYSLHDIFFNKTSAEKMEIISTDRRILLNKLNRSRLARSDSSKISLNKLAKIIL